MVLPIAHSLANYCMLMLRVGQTLDTPRLRHLSSPRAHTTIALLCSRKWRNTSELQKTGALFIVGPNQTHPFHPSNFIRSVMDPQLPEFPAMDTQEPVAFLDAAHANDLRNHRSTARYAFLLCGGAMSYQCKTQSITTTSASSTEAEFLAAVATAKHARYMRAIMTDIGFPPKCPTVMC